MTDRLGDHCGRFLAQLADCNPDICVLDGDLADSDGAIWFAQRYPSRFFMAGIAEQNLVSIAAGLASCGLRPFVFSFAAFLCYRAYDQIRMGLSQSRERVTLVASHSGGATGRNGSSHAALNDLALIGSLPGLTVWCPADKADVEFAIQSVLSHSSPAYLRLPRVPTPELPGAAAPFRWLYPATPASIVSTGYATHWAIAARNLLAERGIELGLLHWAQIDPTPAGFTEEISQLERCVVIEDHYSIGGIASRITSLGFGGGVTAIGWPSTWIGCSGVDAEVLAANKLSTEHIAERIFLWLNKG